MDKTNIKFFVLFGIILLIICILILSFKKNELFANKNCNKYKNINVICHSLDYEFVKDGIKYPNYITTEYINTYLINFMNDVYKPLNVYFNLLEHHKEQPRENLESHYDFKKNKYELKSFINELRKLNIFSVRNLNKEDFTNDSERQNKKRIIFTG